MIKIRLNALVITLLFIFLMPIEVKADIGDKCGAGKSVEYGSATPCKLYNKNSVCSGSRADLNELLKRGCVNDVNGYPTKPILGSCVYNIDFSSREFKDSTKRSITIDILGFLNKPEEIAKYPNTLTPMIISSYKYTTLNMDQILKLSLDGTIIELSKKPYVFIERFIGKYENIDNKCISSYQINESSEMRDMTVTDFFDDFYRILMENYKEHSKLICPILGYRQDIDEAGGELGQAFFTNERPTGFETGTGKNCPGYNYVGEEFKTSSYFDTNGDKSLLDQDAKECTYSGYTIEAGETTSEKFEFITREYTSGRKTIEIDKCGEQAYEWNEEGLHMMCNGRKYIFSHDIVFGDCQNPGYCISTIEGDRAILPDTHDLCYQPTGPTGEYDPAHGCSILSGELGDKINWAFNLIKYSGVVLAIALGMWDFAQAIITDAEDRNQKAAKKLVRRIIAAAIIFLIPTLTQFLLTIIKIPGYYNDTCIKAE